MIDKTTPLQDALAGVRDAATVMIGGFGAPGTPFTLIRGLLDAGATGLTLVKNDANEAGMGISLLFEAGRAARFIVSHMGLNAVVIEMMNKGEIEVEMYPQGILAEKIRCGGAGLPAFLTDIGVETILRDKKELVAFQGEEYICEPSLTGDVALVHAQKADRSGNLVFTGTARNFNPLMATAAQYVVAEAFEIVDTGEIEPDAVHLPGAFVDAVVPADAQNASYEVLLNHVR